MTEFIMSPAGKHLSCTLVRGRGWCRGFAVAGEATLPYELLSDGSAIDAGARNGQAAEIDRGVDRAGSGLRSA